MSKVDLPSHSDFNETGVRPDRGFATNKPRWVCVVGIHAIGLLLLFVILHLTGGGLRGPLSSA